MSTRPLASLAVLASLAAGCGNASVPRDVTCGAAPVEVLPNGNFDGAPAWVEDPTTPALLCGQPTIMPASSPSAACLGSIDGTTQTLTQEVPLPEGAQSVTLSGRICIATADTSLVEHDILQFDLLENGNVIAALGKKTNRDGATDCQFASFELTGTTSSDAATATLRLRSTLDSDLTTTFYLDDLSLKVGCAP
jgi:hypothetical protein